MNKELEATIASIRERYKKIDGSVFGEVWMIGADAILQASSEETLPPNKAYLLTVISWEMWNERHVPDGCLVRQVTENGGPLTDPNHWVVEPVGDLNEGGSDQDSFGVNPERWMNAKNGDEEWKPVDGSLFGEVWLIGVHTILDAADDDCLPPDKRYLFDVISWEMWNEQHVPEGCWLRPTSVSGGDFRDPQRWALESVGAFEDCVPYGDRSCINPAHLPSEVDGETTDSDVPYEEYVSRS